MADQQALRRSQHCSWRSKASAFALALQIVWIGPVAAEDLSPEARSALERGVTAARGQQWLVALQQFDIALEKSPTSPEVLFNLALANDRMGGREIRAIGWYRAYLAIAPKAANREQILARVGELENASRASAYRLIDKALAANRLLPTPGDRNGGLLDIGRAHAKLGDGPGALAIVASTMPENMGTYYIDNAYVALAGELAKAGDLTNADSAIRKIVAADARDGGIDSIASALTSLKRIDEALAYAGNIKGPRRVQTYLDVAQAQAKAKDQVGAHRTLENAISAMNSLAAGDRTPSRFKSIIGTAVILKDLDTAKKQLAMAVAVLNALPKDKRTVDGPENLIEAATGLNDLETARRLYAGINWNSPAAKYADKPHVIYLMTEAYVKARRFADARALQIKITDKFWRQNAVNDISIAMRERSSKLDSEVRKLIRAEKLADAEALLAREPQVEFGVLRTVLADAYTKARNSNAAVRILNGAASAIARETNPGASTRVRVALVDSYRYAGRLNDARRMLDAAATPATLTALQKEPSQASLVDSIVRQYGKLMSAEMQVKNAAAAKSAAAAAIKASTFIKEAPSRGSALQPLAEYAPGFGLAPAINAVALSMPSGSSRDEIFEDLAKGYGAAGARDKAAAAVAKIENPGKRKGALISAIRGYTAAGDWAGALELANDQTVTAALNSLIAIDMLSAGLVTEAMSLESKFAGSAPDLDRYLTALALYFGNSGDFERAEATALRLSDPNGQLSTFRSIVYIADSLAGRAKAKAIFERALKLYGALATPDRLKLCNAPYVVNADVDEHATYKALVTQCRDAVLTAARALKPGQARNVALAKAFEDESRREYVGHMLLNAAAMRSSYDRSSAINHALNIINKEGAAEKYIQLSRDFTAFSERDYLSVMSSAATDAGNKTLANDLMHRWYDLVQADDDDRDRDLGTMVAKLIAMDQLDTAAAILPHIKSASSQFSPLLALATAMVRSGKTNEAIPFIRQAAEKARIANFPYYYDNVARLAAEARDYATAAALQEEFPESYQFSGQIALTAQLLKSGEASRIGASLAAADEALGKDKAITRWYHAPAVAANEAWAGDEKRLANLIARAPQPRFAATMLISAADGYAKAKMANKAREALARALELLHIHRPDFAGWAESRIALAESVVDPANAAKRMMAIGDAEWRTRGAVQLSRAMMSQHEEKQAIALLGALSQFQVAQGDLLLSVVRYLVSHGSGAQAREFIGKMSDTATRDQMRRSLVLLEARRDETEAAISDASTVENAVLRAYLHVDLAAAFAERGQNPQALLINLTANRLAETVTDPIVKSDILTSIAQNQSHLSAGSGEAVKAKAIAVAGTIADIADRDVALRWAEGLDFKKIEAGQQQASKLASDFGDKWRRYITYTLNGELYAGIDVFVRSLTSKDPRQIVASLAQAAGDIGVRISEMQKVSADWTANH